MKNKGLPSSIVKQYGVSKKAWDIYRKRKSKDKRRGKPYKAKKTSTLRSKLARRRYRRKRRRRSPKKFPILPTLGLVGSFTTHADGHQSPYAWIHGFINGSQPLNQDTIKNFTCDVIANYAGIEVRDTFPQKFFMPWGTVTILASILASKIVSKFGANRVFNNLPAPFNRLKF